MGALEQVTINGQLVFRDEGHTFRWLDAFGPDVFKCELKAPIALQAANSLAAFKTTLVGGSTIADTPDIAGGAILISAAAGDNNGVNNHLISEPIAFAQKWPCYMGFKLQTADATQSVLWAGAGIADDDWHGGAPNDYVAFYKADGVATVNFQVATGGNATSLESIATLVDATDITLEMYFDGDYFYAYVNGVLAGSIAYSNANVPDGAEELAPTLEFLGGDVDACTCTLKWARWIQIQRE